MLIQRKGRRTGDCGYDAGADISSGTYVLPGHPLPPGQLPQRAEMRLVLRSCLFQQFNKFSQQQQQPATRVTEVDSEVDGDTHILTGGTCFQFWRFRVWSTLSVQLRPINKYVRTCRSNGDTIRYTKSGSILLASDLVWSILQKRTMIFFATFISNS